MKYPFLLIIKFYQFFISPHLGRNCIYLPTCSEYAKEALASHNIIQALILIAKRILRCHPFKNGCYDPVPKPKNTKCN